MHGIEMGHLRTGMHPGIGPPRHDSRNRRTMYLRQGQLQMVLYGISARLGLPAVKTDARHIPDR